MYKQMENPTKLNPTQRPPTKVFLLYLFVLLSLFLFFFILLSRLSFSAARHLQKFRWRWSLSAAGRVATSPAMQEGQNGERKGGDPPIIGFILLYFAPSGLVWARGEWGGRWGFRPAIHKRSAGFDAALLLLPQIWGPRTAFVLLYGQHAIYPNLSIVFPSLIISHSFLGFCLRCCWRVVQVKKVQYL